MMSTLKRYVKAVEITRSMTRRSRITILLDVLRARLIFGFGPKDYSLYRFHGVPAAVWPSHGIAAPLEQILKRLNPPEVRPLLRDKFAFSEHCLQYNLPVVSTRRLEHLDGDLSRDFGRTLFLKPTDAAHGEGAFSTKYQDGQWHFDGRYGAFSELYNYCQVIRPGKWVVQPLLRTHPQLLTVCSAQALSTLRVISTHTGGESKIHYAVLKIASGRTAIDNFLAGTTGNALATIDLESGCLGKMKYSKIAGWPAIESSDVCPNSGTRMSELQIPLWEEVKNIVMRAHSSLPQFKTLGWDIAVTEAGVFIVEGNSNYSGELLQVAYGRGLREELIGVLSYLEDPLSESELSEHEATPA